MKYAVLLLLVFSLCTGLSAQDIEIFGYFESQYMGISLKSQYSQIYSNKLRVDLQREFSEHVRFGANFDYITYHGKTEYNVLDYLPGNISATVAPDFQPYFIQSFGDVATMYGPLPVLRPERIFLDNAFLKLCFKYLDVTLGKQQISLGAGYVWNPTDVFNTKNILDPTYEQPGNNAIRVDLPLTETFGLVSIYTPEDEWKNSGKLLKLNGNLGHFDFSLIGIERQWSFTDFTPSLFYNPYIPWFPQALSEKRQVFGGDLVGELWGPGIWIEAAFNKMEKTKNFWEVVVGGDYTFDFQTYVMFEYFHNGLGKTDYQQYVLNDWLQMMIAEKRSISRDQIYGLIQHPVTDLINFGLSSIYCISDRSAALIPTLTYNVFENVELFAYLNFYAGKSGQSFSKDFGNGGILRARVYF